MGVYQAGQGDTGGGVTGVTERASTADFVHSRENRVSRQLGQGAADEDGTVGKRGPGRPKGYQHSEETKRKISAGVRRHHGTEVDADGEEVWTVPERYRGKVKITCPGCGKAYWRLRGLKVHMSSGYGWECKWKLLGTAQKTDRNLVALLEGAGGGEGDGGDC